MNPRKVTPIFKISKFDGAIVKTLMDVYQVAEDSGLSVGGARHILHDRSLTAGRYLYEYTENWDGVKNFATVPAMVRLSVVLGDTLPTIGCKGDE